MAVDSAVQDSAARAVPGRAVPDISFLLTHTSHVLATRLTAALAGIGMTPRAHCALVHALPGNLTQIELARLTDMDKTTMVMTLDEMERAGYAERRPSPSDRRARIIHVTGEGQQITAEGQRIVDRVHGEVLAALPPKERDAFVSALNRLVIGYLAEPVECERPVRRARKPS